MIEDETMMRTALARTATAGEPSDAPVDAVFAKAGRLRARRRFQAGLLTVAGIAGIAGTATLFTTHQGAGMSETRMPQVPVEPVATTAPTVKGLTEPRAVLANLTRLLPPSVTAQDSFTQEGFGAIVAVDAAGKTRVEINIQPSFAEAGKPGPTKIDEAFDCATRALESKGDKCEARSLPDGTRVVVVTGTTKGITLRQVDALLPGRLRVAAAEWNAVDEKRGPATRSEPVLTLAQMEALVLDPSWKG